MVFVSCVTYRKLVALKIFYPEKASWQVVGQKYCLGVQNYLDIESKLFIAISTTNFIFLIERPVAFHGAFSLRTCTHLLVQEIEVKKISKRD